MLEVHCLHHEMHGMNLRRPTKGRDAMITSRPNLGAIDLNLLVVFDAVMQERNVTRAGQRINLSQPAMSHALARLRHVLKDGLFIRTPRGMVPTPRAEQLASHVR